MGSASVDRSQRAWCGFIVDDSFRADGYDWTDEAIWPWIFETSEEVWIHQTMVRLAHAGYPVRPCTLTDAASCEVVVVHPGRIKELMQVLGRSTSTRVLLTSSDKTYGRRFADLCAIQHLRVTGSRQVFVPHWPQPGLLKREAAGHRLARAEFKGDPTTLHPDLLDPSWRSALRELGIAWQVSPRPQRCSAPGLGAHPWSDYRDTDVIVALRGDTTKLLNKPASKLVNAWSAGVPAVLSPDPAFTELRCCELDFLEAKTADDAIRALVRLRSEPDLYAAIVEHGFQRARSLDDDAVLAAWVGAICRARQVAPRSRALTIGAIAMTERLLASRRR